MSSLKAAARAWRPPFLSMPPVSGGMAQMDDEPDHPMPGANSPIHITPSISELQPNNTFDINSDDDGDDHCASEQEEDRGASISARSSDSSSSSASTGSLSSPLASPSAILCETLRRRRSSRSSVQPSWREYQDEQRVKTIWREKDTRSVVVVTGGAGFLGRNIVRLLRTHRSGVYHTIRVFDSRPSSLDEYSVDVPDAARVEFFHGDLCDRQALVRAFSDGPVSVVIHVAAIVDFWAHSAEQLFRVNTLGTQNVIEACKECGVKSLVFTGSFCVVVGQNGISMGTERAPYPTTPDNYAYGYYAHTKALAEQYVLHANGAGLRTCVIRALSMYGEEEPWQLPGLLKVTAGRWIARIGDPRCFHHHAYVGNVAWAHVKAADKLLDSENSTVPGKVYIPDDDSPRCNFYEFMRPFFECVGYRLTPWAVPYWLLYLLACLSELVVWLCQPFCAIRLPLTRAALRILCTASTFDGSAARKDLDYEPLFSYQEALRRTNEYIQHQHHPSGLVTPPSDVSSNRTPPIPYSPTPPSVRCSSSVLPELRRETVGPDDSLQTELVHRLNVKPVPKHARTSSTATTCSSSSGNSSVGVGSEDLSDHSPPQSPRDVLLRQRTLLAATAPPLSPSTDKNTGFASDGKAEDPAGEIWWRATGAAVSLLWVPLLMLIPAAAW